MKQKGRVSALRQTQGERHHRQLAGADRKAKLLIRARSKGDVLSQTGSMAEIVVNVNVRRQTFAHRQRAGLAAVEACLQAIFRQQAGSHTSCAHVD
ncbi:hypothetical protein A15D_01447 [Alcanivorax sp. MD8A]|nr:hypothetical protein A15D_01447 [Alcanivorax sp. MD8A]